MAKVTTCLTAGMVHQRLVDLARRNLFAAAIDDLLEAAGEPEIAVLVEDALVAGAEPAVAESFGVGLGVVLVASRDVGAADDDLADLAGRPRGRPFSFMTATSGPAATPTDPGLRTPRKGLEAI